MRGPKPAVELDELAIALSARDYCRATSILMSRHGEYIYGYCRRALADDADAADVSQIVFLQALQCLKDLADARSAFPWLRGIARHRCLDRVRSRRRDHEATDDTEMCDLADGRGGTTMREEDDSLVADPQVCKALEQCLDCLDDLSRMVVLLRFHEELPFEEISKLLSAKEGALRARLTRAVRRMRKCLEHKGVQL